MRQLGRQLRVEHWVQLGVVRRVPDHRVRLVEEEHSGEANPLSELQRRGLLPGGSARGPRAPTGAQECDKYGQDSERHASLSSLGSRSFHQSRGRSS